MTSGELIKDEADACVQFRCLISTIFRTRLIQFLPCTATYTLNSQRQLSVGSLSEDAGVVTPSQPLMENYEMANSQIQFYPNDFCSIIFFIKQIGIPTSFPRSVYTMKYRGSVGQESHNDRSAKTQNMFGEN